MIRPESISSLDGLWRALHVFRSGPSVHRVIVVTLLRCSVPLLAASGQSDQPRWALKTDSDVVLQRLTPQGVLVVATGAGLLAVDTATGRVVWTRTDFRNEGGSGRAAPAAGAFGAAGEETPPWVRLDPLWDTPYAVLTLDSAGARARIEVIDVRTGARRWDSSPLPVRDVRGQFQVPGNRLLLVVGVSGGAGSAHTVVLGVDLESGALRWSADDLFVHAPSEFEVTGSGLATSRGTVAGNQPPVFDGDSTAILFWSQDGPCKIDLRSGAKLWSYDTGGTEPPAPVGRYAPLLLVGGVLYLPFGESLQALDAATGSPRWLKPPKFREKIAQMELTTRGLLVRGAPDRDPRGRAPRSHPFIDLLDAGTGSSKWPPATRDLQFTGTFFVRGDNVYATTDRGLYRVGLADGISQELSAFRFEGNERPSVVEWRDGKLVFLANQNIAARDTAGATLYQGYFAAPSTSFLEKAVGVVLAGYNGAVLMGFFNRYASTQQSARYVYIVAGHADQAGGGPGLLKVNKDTGKVEKGVALGDKTPDYQADPINGLLFYKKGGREIDCYRF